MKIRAVFAKFLRPILLTLVILVSQLSLLLTPQNVIAAASTNSTDSAEVVSIKSLNDDLLKQLDQYKKDNKKDSNKLKKTALVRKDKLKDLIVSSPKDAKKVFLTNTADFPDDVKVDLEQDKVQKGYFSVMHADNKDKTSQDEELISPTKLPGNDATILVGENMHINQANVGKEMTINGIQLDNIMLYSAAGNSQLAANSVTTSSVGGSRNVAIIRVTFTDNRAMSISDTAANNYVFNQYKNYLERTSNGNFTINGSVTPVVNLDIITDCYLGITWPVKLTGNLVARTSAVASANGIDLSPYTDKIIVMDPSVDCGSHLGMSLFGAGWAYTVGLSPIAHEFGHNLSLNHANGWECGPSFMAVSCNNPQYTNYNDIMGGADDFNDGEYGPYARESLGWMGDVTTVSGNGTYTISKIENSPGSNNRALKIPTYPGGPVYYVYYQKKANSTNEGPTIEMASHSLDPFKTTWILDTTPNSAVSDGEDFRDGYLHDGGEVTDAYNGITFRGVSHDGTNATVQISFGAKNLGVGTVPVNWGMATGYFSAAGQKKDMSWSPIHYFVEVKCVGGFGCNGNWNQWSGCTSWPNGTCPPFDETDTSVDIPVGSIMDGYVYSYRVFILTKDDTNPNVTHLYDWKTESDASVVCPNGAHTCTKTLTWPIATYVASLYQQSDGQSACLHMSLPEIAICDNRVVMQGDTSFSFHGLPTDIPFRGDVKVGDFSGNMHLLQDFPNLGTSETFVKSCSNSVATTCDIPQLSFHPKEPIISSLRVTDPNHAIVRPIASIIARDDGSVGGNSWVWDYNVVAFPNNYSDCYQAGAVGECYVQSIYHSTSLANNIIFTGLRQYTDYRVIICAGPCTNATGDPTFVNAVVKSTASGPTFFLNSDPFDQIVDSDADGIADNQDNCIGVFNQDQKNSDVQPVDNGNLFTLKDKSVPNGDNLGDVCDKDNDNDGLADSDENPLKNCGAFNNIVTTHPKPAGGDYTNDDNHDGNPAAPMGTDSADNGPSWDTDNDGWPDGYECTHGSNPRDANSKPTKIASQEITDSDGDGIPDGWEIRWGTCPGSTFSALPACHVNYDLSQPIIGNTKDSDSDGIGDCREIVDVNGDNVANFPGDTLAVAKVANSVPGAGKTQDFDINRDGVINFPGDAIESAKRTSGAVACY